MKYFSLFANRQPYLDADDGVNLGGGGDITPQNESTETNSVIDDDSISLDASDFLTTANENENTDSNDNNESTDETNETDEFNNTDDVNQQSQDENKSVETIKVKFNKEEMDIPIDEATQYIQKGMNYDKILSQKEALEKSKEFEILDYYAQMYGMTRQEYTDYLFRNKEEQALKNEMNDVKSKSPEISDELAEEIALMKIERNKRELEEKKRAEEQKKQDETNKMYSDFMAEYPDIKSEAIPQEVWDKVCQGQTLLSAYSRWENQQLKAKLQAKEQNEKTKKKSTGSVVGDANIDYKDDFLAGFDSI
ncbi:hypothetical protein [Clostridium sp. BNL1100]|uniref:hypothetical protein n=1 Tax=Clostridium sp. BNL1100 TaxID=755731 RepID=UPI00024A7A96|nr:hypothetical protein [Clostridium sp. BNL1100]AEY66606.1 hypothetical protein Clo1100_2435 [Clostridium sp. BNL1100]